MVHVPKAVVVTLSFIFMSFCLVLTLADTGQCQSAAEAPLPLPSSVPPGQMHAFEEKVLAYFKSGAYKNWARDKSVRDTGPYINGAYFGTHLTVRIFYSPKVMEWLAGGRKGAIADGAMIIKEQYTPPAARYDDANEQQLAAGFRNWSIMLKDAAGAKDGWYWGEFYEGMHFDNTKPPFNYPDVGFGQYCIRCHASAEKELTFSALNNIQGFPGEPLSFLNDGSWRTPPAAGPTLNAAGALTPAELQNAEFLRFFHSISVVPDKIEKMVPETLDRVVAAGNGPQQFVTSDQCQMCHSALTGPLGNTMFLPTGPTVNYVPQGVNVSPYGEWRWSPMGLAGRDPIFYAQVESEIAILKAEFKEPEPYIRATVNTCLSCHGGMGKRQFSIDKKDPSADFRIEYTKISNPADPNFKYGGLARDGISCAFCHHATEPPNQTVDNFLDYTIGNPIQFGKADELYGPFKDDTTSTLPMDNGMGIKPKFSAYTKSSRLCGSCHLINLPNVDKPLKPGEKPTVFDAAEKNPAFKPFNHSLEQSTYMEWLNSAYQTEFNPTSEAKSCQDCHMPGSYENAANKLDIKQLQQPIAIVEDSGYPAAEARAPLDKIRVRFRTEGYARHELLGLNAYLLEMFSQYSDILGVRTTDYMSGSTTDLADAIDNVAQQAQTKTATVEVLSTKIENGKLVAKVKVTNRTGHRLPSGVGFRRAFLEFTVAEKKGATENVIWASGRTNSAGIIIGADGQPLPSEFYREYKDGNKTLQHFQPHYEKITAQDQVQIFEELVQDAQGKISTSFIHRDHELKDNRLLPKGWSAHGPSPQIPEIFIEATSAKANAEHDPDYLDGSGTDTLVYEVTLPAGLDPANLVVHATLYSQAIPPSFLNMRFKTAPNGAATQRLYYLTSNLNVTKTPIANWKLKIASARAPVR